MTFETLSLSSNPLTKELCEYQNIKINEAINVLEWWSKNQKLFPNLSKVVLQTFCCPATSVPSERLFSASGYTVWDRRNSLSPRKLEKIMIINQFDRHQKKLNDEIKKRKD